MVTLTVCWSIHWTVHLIFSADAHFSVHFDMWKASLLMVKTVASACYALTYNAPSIMVKCNTWEFQVTPWFKRYLTARYNIWSTFVTFHASRRDSPSGMANTSSISTLITPLVASCQPCLVFAALPEVSGSSHLVNFLLNHSTFSSLIDIHVYPKNLGLWTLYSRWCANRTLHCTQ